MSDVNEIFSITSLYLKKLIYSRDIINYNNLRGSTEDTSIVYLYLQRNSVFTYHTTLKHSQKT